MTIKQRTSFWAFVLMAALLLTACVPLPSDPGIPVSGPAPETPLISIHNPLVIPVGDTPASSGGPFQDWPAFEVEQHRIRIFHPNRWLFLPTQEELAALRLQLGADETAAAFFEEREGYVQSLTLADQAEYFAGAGFPYDPDSPPMETNGFHLLAVPTEGRTLETYARKLSDEIGASGLATVEGIEIGPGLRPWGEETASIQYRIDGTQAFGNRVVTVPDAEVVGKDLAADEMRLEKAGVKTLALEGEYAKAYLDTLYGAKWAVNDKYKYMVDYKKLKSLMYE